jgi:hypothetical protein
MTDIEPLRSFVQDMTRAVDRCGQDGPRMLRSGKELLAQLRAPAASDRQRKSA